MNIETWDWQMVLLVIFVATQVLYLLSFAVEGYFFSRPTNLVEMPHDGARPARYPFVVLFYPVLNELEGTMRTTFEALARLDYPRDRFEVIAIPNASDTGSVASLRTLQGEFPFLNLIEVPATSDPSWQTVWDHWDANPKAYWWHNGARAGLRDLPPKKTRQLIYAFYKVANEKRGGEDFLVNYIDADSAPPRDHFLAAAHGADRFDVMQATNIAGNLLASMPASFHAFDHMAWDGHKYKHLTANGRQPYWVLGKGLFFKASDVVELGGFHPWLTIEDPEVGMRFWKNGRSLGVIESPLIEEVPETFSIGITQRKRWVAGFWQSLTVPLDEMGFTGWEKFKARLNFAPCLSLSVNLIGLPIGLWALYEAIWGGQDLPRWTLILAAINGLLFLWVLGALYLSTYRRSRLVLDSRAKRLGYLLRVNPIFLWAWWLIWAVPLWIGWRMYRKDGGLVWERTEKIDANADLVRGIGRDEPIEITTPSRTPVRS